MSLEYPTELVENAATSIDQLGDNGTSYVYQNANARNDTAALTQLAGSSFNTSTIDQQGASPSTPAFNLASVEQGGSLNTSEVTQSGVGNTATVGQYGSDNNSTVTQFGTGAGNTATVNQLSDSNISSVSQAGDGNTATVTQN